MPRQGRGPSVRRPRLSRPERRLIDAWWNGGHRAGLPPGVRPPDRLARPPLRCHRHRRGGGGRGARGRAGEVAGVRRTSQPRRLAHDHRGQPRDRPDPPREAARRQAPGGLHALRRHAPRAHRTSRGRPVAAALHLLPSRACTGGADRADAAPPRWAERGRDRAGVPRARDHDGAADHPGEEEDRGGEGGLPGARGRRPARAARRRAGGAVPGLQRGLPRHRRRRPGPRRAHRRGHPADADPAPAAPRGAGGGRPARAAGAHRGPA